MKNGTYLVSFYVDLNDCADENEAEEMVATLVSDTLDEGNFPEIRLELIEEIDEDYTQDEDELEEVSFGET